jgi:hypothetical protein
MAATGTHPNHITFQSDATLRWYSPEPTVAYGFCGECGSSLFWKVVAEPTHISICAGGLNPPTGLTTTSAWWLSEASDYAEPSVGVAERRATE